MSANSVDFCSRSRHAAADTARRLKVLNAVGRQYEGRRARWADLPDVQALRRQAADIRQHTLDHLDHYLAEFIQQAEARGAVVHVADDAEAARRIVLDIARRYDCHNIIKSKSMVSEEVHLTPHLQQAGLDVVETDLGEFIVQLDHDAPSHLVTPIIHKSRGDIAALFAAKLSYAGPGDAPGLTRSARAHLRSKFRQADMGMTGGNFLIAETGQVLVVENEGNARQSISSARVLVSMVGVEKLIPRLTDAAVMLKLLPRSATGQPITVYTSLFGGPRGGGQADGPEAFHLVLVDNGRSAILGSEYRDALRCIRCGACLNACPVYRGIGGHAYGHVYSGPIGAVLAPLFEGLARHGDLPQASSLCGACHEVCPVRIDLPGLLIRLRRDRVDRQLASPMERVAYRLWAWTLRHPWLYRLVTQFQRMRLGTVGWVDDGPRPLKQWTDVRSMPAPAEHTFRELWARSRR